MTAIVALLAKLNSVKKEARRSGVGIRRRKRNFCAFEMYFFRRCEMIFTGPSGAFRDFDEETVHFTGFQSNDVCLREIAVE